MSQCHYEAIAVPRCEPPCGSCGAVEEIRDGIEHLTKGLHEMEHGLHAIECNDKCAGEAEYQKGLSDTEYGAHEIIDGLQKIGYGRYYGYCGCGGEVVYGLREIQSGIRHGYEGLAKLTHGEVCRGTALAREAVGETRLGLRHILDRFRGLLGPLFPSFGLSF